jgi:DNA-binding transcriptional MerR regulator
MWLKIGDFAKLSRVSPRMLRHYDRVGLLTPIHTDPLTGYRFYSLDQLGRLRRIAVLRELSFSLRDIALLLADGGQLPDVRSLLRRKQQELRQRIAEDQACVQRIEARLRVLDQETPMETPDERQIFTRLLHEEYGMHTVRLELVHRVAVGQVYRVEGADGMTWDLYTGRTDGRADAIYTTWLSGYSGYSVPDFLLSRAGVLTPS